MNDMNKTENGAQHRMNETENSLTEEKESTDEFLFSFRKEKPQEKE